MDLAQLANIGKFIGGVAALATLVYLAVQVRGSKRSTEATLMEVRLNRNLPGVREAWQRRAFYFSPEFCELLGVDPGPGHRLGGEETA